MDNRNSFTYKSREDLMRMISECEFSMLDLSLYLNTHPDCEKTLELYHHHRRKYEAMSEEYRNKFGPLTNQQVISDKRWTWTNAPWPWEKEGC